MSALFAIASPRRIKAAHRPRRMRTSGHSVYANNNPYKFVDPDGREIVYSLSGGATVMDAAKTMVYLLSSPTARSEISQIATSSREYTLSFDRSGGFGYDSESRTVSVNPGEGLRVASSGLIQTPALGAGHEISHAAEHDRVGTQSFDKSMESNVKAVGNSFSVSTPSEEKRATNAETKMAGELGEAARQNYNDNRGTVTTCTPTSNKEC